MTKYHRFHLVDPSPWPASAAGAVFTTVVGLVLGMHAYVGGFAIFVWGGFNTVMVAALWFRDIVREATFGGHHTRPVQQGLRMGFALFILSEVMFFVSFFWAYLWAALNPAIELGGVWPPTGVVPIHHSGMPAFGTHVLLTSGFALTWSHYALMSGRLRLAFATLAYTCALGVLFLGCQLDEFTNGCTYGISDSVYGAAFFLTTGFHGTHVLVGTAFLLVCLARLRAGHFTPTRHLGLVSAIWYWHFVDVVWLGLYLLVYIWGPISRTK